ncbi:MAG: di-heme oxidoredictase family protein [Campylobacterota bacterium]|nr:di-heme oxidoredictase family protein [Campylobacterota bacterium]
MQIKSLANIALASFMLVGCSSSQKTTLENVENTSATTAHKEVSKNRKLTAKYLTTCNSKMVFSHPYDGMSNEEVDEFIRGKSFFRIPWIEAPSATTARDGLGPLFSANTCRNCHPNNGAGVAVDSNLKVKRDLVFRLSIPQNLNNVLKMKMPFSPEPTYGGQLSVNGNHEVPFEGTPVVKYVEEMGKYHDGSSYSLRVPEYSIDSLNYGPLHKDAVVAPHIALALVGLGLIEQIPHRDILVNEDINDSDGDGISGKANWIYEPDNGNKQLGLFTWKAGSPSVRFQSANAASNDMGLTTSIFPKENCTSIQKECNAASKGYHDFDMPDSRLDAINYYLTHLKAPFPRKFKNSKEAKKLFTQLSCSQCHTPSFVTSEGVEIRPYSDFLLHDMGDELSDGHSNFLATPNEWRTPPLWGIGLYKKVSGEANYLHDGRARSIEEAILWHGGEAQNSKEAFKELPKAQRELLIEYLGTI